MKYKVGESICKFHIQQDLYPEYIKNSQISTVSQVMTK